MGRRIRAATLAAVMLVALLGVQTAPAQARTTRIVRMKDFFFKAKRIKITRGTRVKWVNNSGTLHNTKRRGAWNRDVPDGGTFSRVFRTPGIYRYVCKYHKGLGMKGVIVVT